MITTSRIQKMKGKIVILLVLAGLVSSLSACIMNLPEGGEESIAPTGGVSIHVGSVNVVRFVDEEAGVVCWMFSCHIGYAGSGGITCLPVDETTLGE